MKSKYLYSLLFLTLFCLPAIAQKPQSLLLKDALVYEGPATRQPYKASVLVSKGIIKTISKKKPTPVPPGTRVIDCNGKFLVPGLIDAHIHLAAGDIKNEQAWLAESDSILQNMLAHGITTVRDMAGEGAFLQRILKNCANNKTKTPVVFYSAQFAGPEYFYMIGKYSNRNRGGTPWERAVADTTNIAGVVKEAKAGGVTGIKIYANLSPLLIKKIVQEAHRQGLQAWSHVSVFPTPPSVTAGSGVISMSHAHDMFFEQFPFSEQSPGKNRISEVLQTVSKNLKIDTLVMTRLLATMKAHHVFLDPTLYLAGQNRLINGATTITQWAHKQGVKLVLGTDWPYPTRGANLPLLNEMKLWATKSEIPNPYIIEAATVNGAAVLGLKDRGCIQIGKRADTLVLSKDPAYDLEALFNPDRVIQNGEEIENIKQ